MVAPSNAALVPAARFTGRLQEKAPTAKPVRKALSMRKFHIASLLADGQVRVSDQIGPAMPIFESAFSAFSHGTVIATESGPVAVEDLVPGMKILTTDQRPETLMWVGAMTLLPRSANLPTSSSLTRIMASSFGVGRPESDLMAGPAARLLMHPSRVGSSENVLTPAHQLVDSVNAIEIFPPRPVTVYHLVLRKHVTLSANGMEVESYHPGVGFERNMGPNMLSLFLSFFPHIKQPQDFGPLAYPRLPLGEFDATADVA